MVASAPDEVVLEQRLTAANLDLRVQAHVEFDGMIRFDVEAAAADAVDLDSLSIEIPVRAEHAGYLYHFPGAWGTARNAGALPDSAVRMGFRPYVWLGDEDRGLAWFGESDRDWHVAPGTPATEIVRDGDRVVLTLHLVSAPMRLAPESQRPLAWDTAPELANAVIRDAAVTGERGERYQPLRYTFGLQATPVRGNERGAWDYRCLHVRPAPPAFTEGMTLAPAFLDRCVQAGVRTLALHQYWTDIEAHTIPADRERLHEWVSACHERGLRILLYYGFLISSAAPEWRDFGAGCLTTPAYGYPLYRAPPQPDQSAWVVCLNSAWQDFVADAIATAMDEFGIDGVYLDGTEFPAGCINTLHGCGSTRPDGSIAKSYPIFGVRSAMRRIHTAVTSRKPEGQVNVHNSTCMVMPTLGFGTSYWDGEQFQDVRGIDNAATQLPLDAFRAEFMGRQWGVPAEFLCYGQGFTFEQAWAITLIHDVPVRPMSGTGLEDLEAGLAHLADHGRLRPRRGRVRAVLGQRGVRARRFSRHPRKPLPAPSERRARRRVEPEPRADSVRARRELGAARPGSDDGLDRRRIGAITGSPGRRSRSVRLAAALDQASERLVPLQTVVWGCVLRELGLCALFQRARSPCSDLCHPSTSV